MIKNWENNGMEEIALVTPINDLDTELWSSLSIQQWWEIYNTSQNQTTNKQRTKHEYLKNSVW